MLYEVITRPGRIGPKGPARSPCRRITSYNVCYTKLLRNAFRRLRKRGKGAFPLRVARVEGFKVPAVFGGHFGPGGYGCSFHKKKDTIIRMTEQLSSFRITSYNVCYTKLLRYLAERGSRVVDRVFPFRSRRALRPGESRAGREPGLERFGYFRHERQCLGMVLV